MPKRLFLIDGTALAYRSYFAFASNPRLALSTKTGHPTGATYGFVQTLRALLEREKPDAIAVAFDGPTKDLYRTQVYADYKSTREKMPDDMALQLDDIRELVEGYGIPIVEASADEADDVIATLAVQARDQGLEVFIVTGDKDFLQLVGEHVKLWNLRSSTSKPEIFGPEAVPEKFGVRAEQMIDLLALMGDSSDNVPGVPKVGQKTAAELLAEFGTLEALLERAAEVKKNAVRESLLTHREQALLSKRLVTLKLDVPLPVQATDLGPAQPDPERLRPLFERLEFESLLKTLQNQARPDPVEQDYGVVQGAAAASALAHELQQAGAFAFAVELGFADPRTGRLLGLAFCARPGHARYVPLDQDRDAVLTALRPLFQDPRLHRATADSKAALAALRTAGLEARAVPFDTTLASYCIDAGENHGLDRLALRHFGYKMIEPKELVGSGRKQKTFADVDLELVARHACERADFTLRVRSLQEPVLREAKVEQIYRELELPLVPVLLDMEHEGIAIDVAHLDAVGREFGARLAEIEKRVFQRAGAEFNLNSPQQLAKVLFEDLEVHRAADYRPKKTKTGQYKTDADVLEMLAQHHEVPALVLQYRELSKLKGTYVDPLPGLVDAQTGRIHTTFNQAVAATGRLSSDHPNLQNIPIRTEEGKKVRAAFVPRGKGWVLLSADYSQIELRILAHLSGDRALVESFRKGEDIHRRTAAIVHGMMPELVSPELRNQAKVINYGLMYGMGASRLGNETGMTPVEARRFIEAYFRALPGVKRYLDSSLEQARGEKQVWTMFGRRRPLPDIDSTNGMLRVAAENMAVNTPIQGAAADIVKRAMLRVHRELGRRGLAAKLILQVHDELVLDVPAAEVDTAKAIVVEGMMGAAELAVPLEVSVGVGANWLVAH